MGIANEANRKVKEQDKKGEREDVSEEKKGREDNVASDDNATKTGVRRKTKEK